MNYLRTLKYRWKHFERTRGLLKFLTICLLLITQFNLPVNASPDYSSQSISLKVRAQKLSEVLGMIEEKAGYSFFYNSKELKLDQNISVEFEGNSISELLDKVFQETKIVYTIRGNQILLTAKTEKELPSKPVTGKVTDEKSNPLPGVSIVVKGTSHGVVTDVNGRFSLTVNTKDILIFSMIGYQKQEVPVEGIDNSTITMTEDHQKINEIVVTALGIKRDVKALGYSISKVNSEEIDKFSPNAMAGIQGKVTGVNLLPISSDPMSSVLMTIRGATSLNIPQSTASSQPLIVIDGIPITTRLVLGRGIDIGNVLSDLNPNDIETINILKGSSAGALYGSEAGNGVILITTKKGKGGKKGLGIEISSSYTVNTIPKTIPLQTEFAGGDRDIYTFQQVSGGYGPSLENGIQGKRWNVETQQYDDNVTMYSANENRIRAFLEPGSTFQNSIVISQSNENSSFRLSYLHLTNNSNIPNNLTLKNAVSLSSITKLSPKVSVSANASYTNMFSPNKTNSANLIQSLYFLSNQIQPIKSMKDYWLKGEEGIAPNPIMFSGDQASVMNPYWYVNEAINKVNKDWFFGSASLNWDITSFLSGQIRSGIDFNSYDYESRTAYGYTGAPKGNFGFQSESNMTSNTDIIFTYKKDFGKFSSNINAGYNFKYISTSATALSAAQLARPNDYNISNAVPGTESRSYNWNKAFSQSVFGTFQLGYASAAYLELTGREDFSGILPEDKDNYFYPSASLSVIPTSMFKLPELLSFLKLRFGIAQVGHGIGNPRNRDLFGFAGTDWNGVKLATISGSVVDPDLKYEVTNSSDIGFEFSLLKNRLSGDFTVFRKKHVNQLMDVTIPQSSGNTSMKTNVGDVLSKGYEWSLNGSPIQTRNLSWGLGVNFSKADSYISRLTEQFGAYQYFGIQNYLYYKLAEGERIGNMYQKYTPVYVEEGKYKGQMIIRWNDGEGWLREREGPNSKPIGNFNPDFIMGFTSNLKYKNWSLNILANLRYGGQYYSNSIQSLAGNDGNRDAAGLLPNTLTGNSDGSTPGWVGGRDAAHGGMAWIDPSRAANDVVKGRLTNSGRSTINDASYLVGVYVNPASGKRDDDSNAGDENYIVNGTSPETTLWTTPAMAAYDWYYKYASNVTYSATNFKINEISLTYNFDESILRNTRIEKAAISLVSQNVFIWTESGINEDPESAFSISSGSFNQGVVYMGVPKSIIFGFNLTIGF